MTRCLAFPDSQHLKHNVDATCVVYFVHVMTNSTTATLSHLHYHYVPPAQLYVCCTDANIRGDCLSGMRTAGLQLSAPTVSPKSSWKRERNAASSVRPPPCTGWLCFP
eukprot:16250208-Heterocapsa_arctica.AAC.1